MRGALRCHPRLSCLSDRLCHAGSAVRGGQCVPNSPCIPCFTSTKVVDRHGCTVQCNNSAPCHLESPSQRILSLLGVFCPAEPLKVLRRLIQIIKLFWCCLWLCGCTYNGRLGGAVLLAWRQVNTRVRGVHAGMLSACKCEGGAHVRASGAGLSCPRHLQYLQPYFSTILRIQHVTPSVSQCLDLDLFLGVGPSCISSAVLLGPAVLASLTLRQFCAPV